MKHFPDAPDSTKVVFLLSYSYAPAFPGLSSEAVGSFVFLFPHPQFSALCRDQRVAWCLDLFDVPFYLWSPFLTQAGSPAGGFPPGRVSPL